MGVLVSSSVQAVKWWQYVQDVSDGAQQSEIARRLRVDQSTVSRWKGGVPGKPENVVRFAREYRRPVLEAFVAAGFLTTEDANATVTVPDIGQLSAADLLAEVRRRMREEVVGNAEHPAPMNPTGGSPVTRHLSAVSTPDPTSDDDTVSEPTPTVIDYEDLHRRADAGEFDDPEDIAALSDIDPDEDSVDGDR